MKKIILFTVMLIFYFFNSYSQDSVTIKLQRIDYEYTNLNKDRTNRTTDTYYSTKSTKKVKRFFYKIGDQKAVQLQGNGYKAYKEYISSNENASKNLKNYIICTITYAGGFAAILVGVPILIFVPPAGLICIGAGIVTLITSKELGEHFLLKSAKVFNKSLKKNKTVEK
jgi:hypothetical protein